MPMSTAKLPKPFHEAEFRGKCLMTRSDADAAPVDFSLEEYLAFKAKPAEPWQEISAEDEEEEEDEEDEDEDAAYDSEDADKDEAKASRGDKAAFRDLLMASALEKLEAKEGRPATEEEEANINSALEAKFGAVDEEEEDLAIRGEAIIIEKISVAFEAK